MREHNMKRGGVHTYNKRERVGESDKKGEGQVIKLTYSEFIIGLGNIGILRRFYRNAQSIFLNTNNTRPFSPHT